MHEPLNERLREGRGWGASVLFVAIFCYFWIGLAPFPNANDPGLSSPYGSTANSLNQVIVIAMATAAFAMLWRHPARRLAMQPHGLLLAIFVWLLLSALFSAMPGAVVRRTVYAALVCLCANTFLLLPRNSDHFAKLMGYCLLFVAGLDVLGTLAFPDRAFHQASDTIEQALAGDWRGHFGHKNEAAAAMVLAAFFGLYIAKRRSAWVGGAIVVCASFFLVQTGGKTSVAMLPAIWFASMLFERSGSLRMPIVVMGLVGFNLLLLSAASSASVSSFIASLGIDPSFTGRTAIWQVALAAIGERPLTGHGFQTFWQVASLFNSAKASGTWAVTAANAHSGYLDLMINGGIPLLCLGCVWLVILPCRHATAALKRGSEPELTRLFIRVWLFALFLSCLESPFFVNSGPIWFSVLLAVFGLRLQAYAALSKAPASDTPPRPASLRFAPQGSI